MPGISDTDLALLLSAFESGVAEVLTTACGLTPARSLENSLGAYTCILPLENGPVWLFMVRIDEDGLRTLTGRMLGEPPEAVSENEMTDCIGEFCNMVCGACKARLSQTGTTFGLTSPIVLKEHELPLTFRPGTRLVTRSYACEGVELSVQIVLL